MFQSQTPQLAYSDHQRKGSRPICDSLVRAFKLYEYSTWSLKCNISVIKEHAHILAFLQSLILIISIHVNIDVNIFTLLTFFVFECLYSFWHQGRPRSRWNHWWWWRGKCCFLPSLCSLWSPLKASSTYAQTNKDVKRMWKGEQKMLNISKYANSQELHLVPKPLRIAASAIAACKVLQGGISGILQSPVEHAAPSWAACAWRMRMRLWTLITVNLFLHSASIDSFKSCLLQHMFDLNSSDLQLGPRWEKFSVYAKQDSSDEFHVSVLFVWCCKRSLKDWKVKSEATREKTCQQKVHCNMSGLPRRFAQSSQLFSR